MRRRRWWAIDSGLRREEALRGADRRRIVLRRFGVGVEIALARFRNSGTCRRIECEEQVARVGRGQGRGPLNPAAVVISVGGREL